MSGEAPKPHLQNPIKGTTIDTSPGALGLEEQAEQVADSETPTSSYSHKRAPSLPKNVIKRVEQTAAKLGSSVLGTYSSPKRENNVSQQQQQPQQQSGTRLSMSLTSADPRRFLSLSRKGKAKEKDVAEEEPAGMYLFST